MTDSEKIQALQEENLRVINILAEALGYSRGEPGNPGSYAIGDHTVETLASEIGHRLKHLQIEKQLVTGTLRETIKIVAPDQASYIDKLGVCALAARMSRLILRQYANDQETVDFENPFKMEMSTLRNEFHATKPMPYILGDNTDPDKLREISEEMNRILDKKDLPCHEANLARKHLRPPHEFKLTDATERRMKECIRRCDRDASHNNILIGSELGVLDQARIAIPYTDGAGNKSLWHTRLTGLALSAASTDAAPKHVVVLKCTTSGIPEGISGDMFHMFGDLSEIRVPCSSIVFSPAVTPNLLPLIDRGNQFIHVGNNVSIDYTRDNDESIHQLVGEVIGVFDPWRPTLTENTPRVLVGIMADDVPSHTWMSGLASPIMWCGKDNLINFKYDGFVFVIPKLITVIADTSK